MRPEPHDEKMDAKAAKELDGLHCLDKVQAEAILIDLFQGYISLAFGAPISRLVRNWKDSEEMEIYHQLAPRLGFTVSPQLQPFIGAIYKLAYADGMEQERQSKEV